MVCASLRRGIWLPVAIIIAVLGFFLSDRSLVSLLWADIPYCLDVVIEKKFQLFIIKYPFLDSI